MPREHRERLAYPAHREHPEVQEHPGSRMLRERQEHREGLGHLVRQASPMLRARQGCPERPGRPV